MGPSLALALLFSLGVAHASDAPAPATEAPELRHPIVASLVGAALLHGRLANASERPVGDANKEMYQAFLLARLQAEPAETLPVSTGLSLGVAVHPRMTVGGTLSVHADEDEGGVLMGNFYLEVEAGYELWKVRPEVFAEYSLHGNPAQGWSMSLGAGWLGMRSWPGGVDTTGALEIEDLKGRGRAGGTLEARLGTGYRWTFHPGAVFHLETGLKSRALTVADSSEVDVPRFVPYLQVATGAAFARGGAPRPGYRSMRSTGRVKPELVVGLVGASVVGTIVTAAGVMSIVAYHGNELD